MHVGNKRLYILKQARTQKLQVCLSTHDLSLPTCIKWLHNMWNKNISRISQYHFHAFIINNSVFGRRHEFYCCFLFFFFFFYYFTCLLYLTVKENKPFMVVITFFFIESEDDVPCSEMSISIDFLQQSRFCWYILC